jgi:hypothetical protein
MNELALWIWWSLGASVDLEGKTLAAFWVAQILVGVDQSRSRCRTRDELARSVNQDVMLTCVVRNETESVRSAAVVAFLLLWAG